MKLPADRRGNEELSPREGLAEKLKALIESLHEKTSMMEEAIISHDVGRIWSVLADQESVAAEFEQYSCLWGHLASSNRGNPEVERAISEINSSFERLRRRNRGNMALIKSFLSAINRSFKKSGTQIAKAPVVYGRHGKMQYKQSSLVVSRVG